MKSVREGKWIYHSLVKDQKFLTTIFKSLTQFEESNENLELDIARFAKRLKLREKGRCQVPSRIGYSLESKTRA